MNRLFLRYGISVAVAGIAAALVYPAVYKKLKAEKAVDIEVEDIPEEEITPDDFDE